jgi:hypothetical protein
VYRFSKPTYTLPEFEKSRNIRVLDMLISMSSTHQFPRTHNVINSRQRMPHATDQAIRTLRYFMRFLKMTKEEAPAIWLPPSS